MWSEEGMLTCGQRACDIGRGAPKMGMGAPSARVVLKHRGGETIFRSTSVVRLIVFGFLVAPSHSHGKTYSIPAKLGPSLQNTIQVFLSQPKHNVSPAAKEIIFQLLGEKTPSQKFLKN